MKPSLQLNLSQQLTMTPQLQQAIKLLQLSALDLQSEIQHNLDENPLLEEAGSNSDQVLNATESTYDWSQWYTEAYRPKKKQATGNGLELDELNTKSLNLADHLTWQIQLAHFDETEELIATIIVDSIDEKGMLNATIDELVATIGSPNITEVEVLDVLTKIQQFDPIGVGARSLAECLALQLNKKYSRHALLKPALNVINYYLPHLAKHDFNKITKELKISHDSLFEIIKLIKTLNPMPGLKITDYKSEYIIPDLIIKKTLTGWVIELNAKFNPQLQINAEYAKLIKNVQTKIADNDTQYLKDKLQEAKWFLKSIENRNSTLLKVAKCIMEAQHEFLEYGDKAMQPLILSDVAAKVEMHESTISRVTTRKYINTPRGTFELKYFFSSQVGTNFGISCSSTKIRAIIKQHISQENKAKPLSDNQITKILKENGINIARRTVAKYRESMKIPASSIRKQIIS